MDWTVLLPYALQIIAWILGRVSASAETVAAFQRLVDSAKNDGLISADTQAKYKDLDSQLAKQFPNPKP